MAICLTLMTYLASSVLGLMIFVQRATCAAHARVSAGPSHLCAVLRRDRSRSGCSGVTGETRVRTLC